MSEAIRVLRVFLASPGDLVDERQIAREVIDDLNESIRPLRLHIDLLGWEDTRPGAGRPQALINRDVDMCELFVGLMWRHWGTPTGTHSSGFEEEFERAQRRRATGSTPDIWLSFKAIGTEHLKDPGPQLRRVLDFRQQQIERREVLFKEFTTPDEWRNLLRKWLLSFVLELSRSDSAVTGAVASPPSAATPSNEPATTLPGSSSRSPQLDNLAEFIRASDPDSMHLAWPDETPAVAIAHLQILASAAMASRYSDVLLGIHEANLAYTMRSTLEPTAFERFQVLRSVIADRHQRVPGWYWFTPSDPVSALFAFAADKDETVSTRALAILRAAEIPPSTEFAQRVLNTRLKSKSVAIRDAAVEYLAVTGGDSAVTLPDFGDDVAMALFEAALAARLRRGDETVLEALEERPVLTDRLQSAATAFTSEASIAGLLRAVSSRHDSLRVSASEALLRAGGMPDTLAFALTRDPAAKVRSAAYAALIAAGAEVDLAELKNTIAELSADESRTRLVAYYRRLPVEKLVTRLEYLGIDGEEIYEALGLEYPARFLERVRRDLGDEMVEFYAEWLRAVRANNTEADAQTIETAWAVRPDLLAFIKRRYIAVALRVIAAKGRPSDVAFAREHIGSDDSEVITAAVAAIARFGAATDAVALVDVAHRTYGATAERAAVAATKLSRNAERVLLPLLRSGKVRLIRPALVALRRGSQRHAVNILRDLLSSDQPSTRILAADALVDIDRTRAQETLEEYLQDYHFYDTVCWLDRLLFAPKSLQVAFRHELPSD